MKKSEVEAPPRLPVKLDTATNGEFAPFPLSPEVRTAKAVAMAKAEENARALGVSRRRFLGSLCGVATTLITLNEAFAYVGKTAGFFDLPGATELDLELAASHLAGDEFIFDDQTHHVNPDGPWRQRDRMWNRILPRFPQGRCGLEDAVDCFSASHYIKELFFDSDTAMAVLSHPPAPADANPLTTSDAAATRALVEALDGSPRLLIQGMVLPSLPPAQSQMDEMERMAEEWKPRSWKTFTNWGPDGGGWWLDDPKVGLPFIEKARRLGVKVIAVHKGLPFSGFDPAYSSCRDIGVVARLFPDVNFVVYHSGYDTRVPEGPYYPAAPDQGVNSLIKTLLDNGIAPNSNVYAELGATWLIVMRNPTAAAHVLGKLLKYVGEERLLWGTDSIWWGSPQDQIQAFRAFQIAEPTRERYGYPALTPALKRKVFGFNALSAFRVDPKDVVKKIDRDRIGRLRAAYLENPTPSFLTYGPKTRAEFNALRRMEGKLPG